MPIVTHASLVLRNWRRIDLAKPLSADNAALQLGFPGGVDEEWFFLATLEVELKGAPALPILVRLGDLVRIGDTAGLSATLLALVDHVQAMRAALGRMEERCRPSVFYRLIRPFLAGGSEPGLIYEGGIPVTSDLPWWQRGPER